MDASIIVCAARVWQIVADLILNLAEYARLTIDQDEKLHIRGHQLIEEALEDLEINSAI